MRFGREIHYVNNPQQFRWFWAAIYVGLASLLVGWFLSVIASIRTHEVPSGQVSLEVPYSKYAVGDTVTFTLTNHYNSPIFVKNSCPGEPLEVYRKVDGQWVRQHDTAAISDCPLQQRQVEIPADGTVSGSFAPWHKLFSQTGTYRIVAYVEFYNALPYQDIEIVDKPAVAQSSAPAPAAATTNVATGSSPADTTEDTTIEPTPSPSPSHAPTPAPSPAPAPTSPPTPAPQTKTVTSAGGSINVSYTSTYITVLSISPKSGCTSEGGRSGSQVQVTFKCGGTETQVTLSLNNGQLTTRTETGD